MDTIFCSVWEEESLHGFVVWVLILATPILLGPGLATVLELLHWLTRRCSRQGGIFCSKKIAEKLKFLTNSDRYCLQNISPCF